MILILRSSIEAVQALLQASELFCQDILHARLSTLTVDLLNKGDKEVIDKCNDHLQSLLRSSVGEAVQEALDSLVVL